MFRPLIGLVFLLLIAASPAQALCSGDTIPNEFREADAVVRVRVISELSAWDDQPSADYVETWGDGAPVVLYGLEVVETFKGTPQRRINFFQTRDSGAFYLEPDGEYLLFLHGRTAGARQPAAARGTLYVRHACGQSRAWSDVKPADLAAIRLLGARR